MAQSTLRPPGRQELVGSNGLEPEIFMAEKSVLSRRILPHFSVLIVNELK